MKKVSLILSAVVISVMMTTSCGGGSSSNFTPTNKVSLPYEVTVGNQVWMTENLTFTSFNNGDQIPEANSREEWENAKNNKQPAWCYYNFDPANDQKYGQLYNWYAVNDPRGLAPAGYHIPTKAEWIELTEYLGGESVAGKKMKFTDGWEIFKGYSGNGTNESGFSGLPGGVLNQGTEFYASGYTGFWWSSTETEIGWPWIIMLDYDSDNVELNYEEKGIGISVRCIKD